jgi:hypothetical protein
VGEAQVVRARVRRGWVAGSGGMVVVVWDRERIGVRARAKKVCAGGGAAAQARRPAQGARRHAERAPHAHASAIRPHRRRDCRAQHSPRPHPQAHTSPRVRFDACLARPCGAFIACAAAAPVRGLSGRRLRCCRRPEPNPREAPSPPQRAAATTWQRQASTKTLFASPLASLVSTPPCEICHQEKSGTPPAGAAPEGRGGTHSALGPAARSPTPRASGAGTRAVCARRWGAARCASTRRRPRQRRQGETSSRAQQAAPVLQARASLE